MLRLALGMELLPLLTEFSDNMPTIEKEDEGHYANWKSGTMDFTMAPLPIEDNVHTVSKIISLWDIPSQQEQIDARMPHALLAWTGGATTLMQFLEGFVVIGEGDLEYWSRDKLEPIHDYILSLRAPTNPELPPAELIDEGEELFFGRGCIDCHKGPRGSGTQTYTFEEIGTDGAMKFWADPEGNGEMCCGLDQNSDSSLTQEIKSPRLSGLWTLSHFLHNGSIDRLEDLLCLDMDRPTITEEPYSDRGHTYGCYDLTREEKEALLAFLYSL